MAKSGAERVVVITPIVGQLDDRIVAFIAITDKSECKTLFRKLPPVRAFQDISEPLIAQAVRKAAQQLSTT